MRCRYSGLITCALLLCHPCNRPGAGCRSQPHTGPSAAAGGWPCCQVRVWLQYMSVPHSCLLHGAPLCHIAAAEMHSMTGGAACSWRPWPAVAPAAPCHRDVYNADIFVAVLQGQGMQLLPHPPDGAHSVQLKLGEHYDALGSLQRTYAGARHIRCVHWVAVSRGMPTAAVEDLVWLAGPSPGCDRLACPHRKRIALTAMVEWIVGGAL